MAGTALLKYPGGKERELPIITAHLPEAFRDFYDPFVGGGSVFFGVTADRYFINDRSDELIGLYRAVQTGDADFFRALTGINENWKLLTRIVREHAGVLSDLYGGFREERISADRLSDRIFEFMFEHGGEFNGMLHADFNYHIDNFIGELRVNLLRKMQNMRRIERKSGLLLPADVVDNIECAFKSAFYMHFRYLMNHRDEIGESAGFDAAVYLFIRDTCYSSMFRYNSHGGFNVPYGGISYNRKNFDKKLVQYRDEAFLRRLGETTIGCADFQTFMEAHRPTEEDLVFLDPPYDTEFSTYAENEFSQGDQERLAEYLMNECQGMFMMVVKNTELIQRLYPEGAPCANGRVLKISSFDKRYSVSFMNRNDKNVKHLMITNY